VRDLSSATLDEAMEILAENSWSVREALEALQSKGMATVRAR
jgi:hypothetical protein